MTEIRLERIEGLKFKALNAAGKSALIDGPASLGGSDDGVRPMEMILMGLAGCSSFDILHILKKSRQEVKDFDITVQGDRADAVPSVFTTIRVHFILTGELSEKHVKRAIDLSMEKYCSVSAMLEKSVKIEHSFEIKPL